MKCRKYIGKDPSKESPLLRTWKAIKKSNQNKYGKPFYDPKFLFKANGLCGIQVALSFQTQAPPQHCTKPFLRIPSSAPPSRPAPNFSQLLCNDVSVPLTYLSITQLGLPGVTEISHLICPLLSYSKEEMKSKDWASQGRYLLFPVSSNQTIPLEIHLWSQVDPQLVSLTQPHGYHRQWPSVERKISHSCAAHWIHLGNFHECWDYWEGALRTWCKIPLEATNFETRAKVFSHSCDQLLAFLSHMPSLSLFLTCCFKTRRLELLHFLHWN